MDIAGLTKNASTARKSVAAHQAHRAGFPEDNCAEWAPCRDDRAAGGGDEVLPAGVVPGGGEDDGPAYGDEAAEGDDARGVVGHARLGDKPNFNDPQAHPDVESSEDSD